jgi:hypothetical protein
MLMRRGIGRANHVLSQAMTKHMLTPGIWELGAWGANQRIKGRSVFSHDGINAGFESLFVGYDNHSDGAVVMTNAQGGERLAKELMQSTATDNWPNFRGKMMVSLPGADLSASNLWFEARPG